MFCHNARLEVRFIPDSPPARPVGRRNVPIFDQRAIEDTPLFAIGAIGIGHHMEIFVEIGIVNRTAQMGVDQRIGNSSQQAQAKGKR